MSKDESTDVETENLIIKEHAQQAPVQDERWKGVVFINLYTLCVSVGMLLG
jgi:hypothetical protein